MKRVLLAVAIVVVVGVVAFSVYSRNGGEAPAPAVAGEAAGACAGNCAACPDVSCGKAVCLDNQAAGSGTSGSPCPGHPNCTCGENCKDNPNCTCPESCRENCPGRAAQVSEAKGTCPGTCGGQATAGNQTPCQKKCGRAKKAST